MRVPTAFTLVELLVVIGIIAVLAALVTPAVMRAQASARNAAIKAEIDMLHMAIMNYKNEYGSFPPCYDGGSGRVNSHLGKLFPRASQPIASPYQCGLLNPMTALRTWLGGYTDNPQSPITPAADRKKLFDFDQARCASTDNTDNASRLASQLVYYPTGRPESPYLYIASGTTAGSYGLPAAPNVFSVPTSTYVPGAASWNVVSINFSSVTAERQVLVTGTSFFNPDTFQILSAGRDGEFGNDDDLSNFWPGTRKDYRDSLEQ